MKTQLYRAILLAGALGFGAAAGSAQTFRATVPFGFQLPNTQMPAGEYTVRQLSPGTPILVISNFQARKSAMVAATVPIGTPNHGDPRLVFRCAESKCALAEVWGASSYPGLRLSEPHHDQERMSVVYFERKTGDKQ
jgi:hypothetical protein